ncbi:hypothetical protein O181_002263 [Austropuccinia psidii MF-1]|uniref:Uncharacterized protein n=1 Tax=Austropuccinia psidii MF-1 TaxID=1389203 RepID=A0A9Q3GCG7_9BASI|nr:hypothetical protein [Austropuccinia psidii MF-1]
MNCWCIPKKLLKEEESVRYSNGWNTLLSKPKIKKIKDWHNEKREVTKEEAQQLLTESHKPAILPKKGRGTRKRIGGSHMPQVKGFQTSKKMPWTMSSTWP